MTFDYEALSENLAATDLSDEEIVGEGDFDRVGAIELASLREAGLQPSNVLVDFGCGTGRLALHAVPFLQRRSLRRDRHRTNDPRARQAACFRSKPQSALSPNLAP